MATLNISLNENKQEAFSEWVDAMTSYFVINSVKEPPVIPRYGLNSIIAVLL